MLEYLVSPFILVVNRRRFCTQGNLTCPGFHTASSWDRFGIKMSKILTLRLISIATLDGYLLCDRHYAKGWMPLPAPLLLGVEAGVWSNVCPACRGKDMGWPWFFPSWLPTHLCHAAAAWSSCGGSSQSEGSSHKCWRGLRSAQGFCRQDKTAQERQEKKIKDTVIFTACIKKCKGVHSYPLPGISSFRMIS